MKKLSLAAALILSVLSGVNAQEEKKVIIRRPEKSDEKPIESTLKEKSVTIRVDADQTPEDKNATIFITKEMNDGKEKTIYKLTEEAGGEVKVIQWDGKGEMPAEMKEIFKDVEIDFESTDDKKVIWIEKDSRSGVSDMTKVLQMETRSPVQRVKLGVLISDNNYGVNVDEVFKGSSADKAGMEKGDVILKLNDKYIFSEEGLFETLDSFKAGEKISITVIRQNKEKSMNLTF